MSTAEAPTHLRENPYEIARQQLRRVGETFGIDPNLINVLERCKKSVEVSIPVTMDDGTVGVFERLPRHAQHRPRPVEGRDPLPPGRHARRGQGARDVDDLEVRADGPPVRRRQGRRRSATRSGSRGGELERLTRRFTSEIINEIGPEKDIPAPDVGTDASVMAWIFDTYSMNKGHSVLGVVTGKPLAIGGSLGREEATARGALYVIADALEEENKGARRAARRGAGLRQRRPPPRAAARARRARSWSRSPTRAAASTRRTGSTCRRCSRTRPSTERSTGFAGADAITNDELLAARVRRARAVRARAGDPRGERGAGEGADRLRGRERADHAGRGRDPRGPRRPRPPGRARERGRRRRLLLRVGAGPPGVLLEGGGGERAAERHRHARVPARRRTTTAAHETSMRHGRLRARRPARRGGDRSRGGSIPRVVALPRRRLPPLRAGARGGRPGAARATSSGSTSAAIPSSRPPTASRSPSSRSTASARSRTSSSPTRCGGG